MSDQFSSVEVAWLSDGYVRRRKVCRMHRHILCFLSLLLATSVACAKFNPEPIDSLPCTADGFVLEAQLEQPRARIQANVLPILAFGAVLIDAPNAEAEAAG